MIPFAHFSIGGAIAIFITFAIVNDVEKRLLLSFPALMIGGALAMVPDIAHIVPALSILEHQIIGNFFLFHVFLDSINSEGILFELIFSALIQMWIFLTIVENRVRVINRRQKS